MSRLLLLLALALPCTVQALEVVASIRPLALIADAVTGDPGQVRQLVPNGASSHEYALKPSDRALLARAGLVLWVGPFVLLFAVALVIVWRIRRQPAGHPASISAEEQARLARLFDNDASSKG